MTTGKDLTLVSTIPAAIHVPLATENVDAGTVEIPFQDLGNYCQALEDGKIVIKSGVTMTCNSGGHILGNTGSTLVWNGSADFNGTGAQATTIADADVISVQALTVTTTLSVPSPCIVTLQGGTKLEVFGRSRGRSLVALPDSTPQTIDTTQGDEFVLPNTPTAGPPIVILLRDTAPIPLAQERLRFIVRDCGAAAITNGGKYEFRRETSNTLIATFIYPQSGVHVSIWAEFVLDGATYHLSKNSGGAYDSVPNFFGVMPGNGA